jgi:hypothetical protein
LNGYLDEEIHEIEGCVSREIQRGENWANVPGKRVLLKNRHLFIRELCQVMRANWENWFKHCKKLGRGNVTEMLYFGGQESVPLFLTTLNAAARVHAMRYGTWKNSKITNTTNVKITQLMQAIEAQNIREYKEEIPTFHICRCHFIFCSSEETLT